MPELKIKCPHCDMITGTGMGLGEGTKFNPDKRDIFPPDYHHSLCICKAVSQDIILCFFLSNIIFLQPDLVR